MEEEDVQRYRALALKWCQEAAAVQDDAQQQTYLAIADGYKNLAKVLAGRQEQCGDKS